jgi:putative ribosome biogenesis GTPase RsgA
MEKKKVKLFSEIYEHKINCKFRLFAKNPKCAVKPAVEDSDMAQRYRS